MPKKEQLTFPPGVLGLGPARLPVLGSTDEWFALSKPSGFGATPHALYEEAPALLPVLAEAVAAGRRQLVELGICGVSRVHMLEPEATGAVLFGKDEVSGAKLRAAMGARGIEFVYDLLVEDTPAGSPIQCALPMTVSGARMRPIVSHRHGKKCATVFSLKDRYGSYGLWEARTRDCRPLQVRLHAAECGLRIAGERMLGRVPLVFLSAIKRHYRQGNREERPLHGPLCLHLREIVIGGGEAAQERICCPRPRSFEVMLRRLEMHAGVEVRRP